MKINVEFKPEQVLSVKALLNGIEADKLMTNAINDTLDGVRTDTTRAVYAEFNLTQTRIRKNFTIIRARRDKISGAFVSKGERINLASFIGARETTRGLSVKIWRNGAREIFKHGFLWTRTTKSGDIAKTAFERQYEGEFGRTKASNKLPWKRMYPGTNPAHPRRAVKTMTTIAIEDFLSREAVIAELEKKGADRLSEETERLLDYYLSKK